MEPFDGNTKVSHLAVVAKHSWYLRDANEIFSGTSHKISLFNTITELEVFLEASSPRIDYIFFPHISNIIPAKLYRNFQCVGFHTGDLPKDRGGSPIQNKILLREYLTKVSAFRIGEEIDAGAIYAQKKIDLSSGNIEDILRRMSSLCAQMMFEVVNAEIKPKDQLGATSSFRRLTQKDSLIPVSVSNLVELYDRIRMVDGLDYPKAYVTVGNLNISFANAKFEGDALTATCSLKLGSN